MIFEAAPLSGAYVITPEPVPDHRGFFARLFCAKAFSERGLDPHLDQISMSFNAKAGTLRGLHIQLPPFAEAKLVRVTAGAIFDVIVDVRAGSPTYGRWFGVALSAANRREIYIPRGFAHGFQTLEPDTEVLYHISAPYSPAHATGLRWDDPELGIDWPQPSAPTLSERDSALPRLRDFSPVEV